VADVLPAQNRLADFLSAKSTSSTNTQWFEFFKINANLRQPFFDRPFCPSAPLKNCESLLVHAHNSSIFKNIVWNQTCITIYVPRVKGEKNSGQPKQ